MEKLDLKQALYAWRFHEEKINATQPISERTRNQIHPTTREIIIQTVKHQPKLVTGSEYHTGLVLITEYVKLGKKVEKSNKIIDGLQKFVQPFGLKLVLADFASNRVMESTSMKRRLKKLARPEIGLITRLEFKTAEGTVIIWLNPSIILPEPFEIPEEYKELFAYPDKDLFIQYAAN